ncbi:MAG: 16S rRNA (adenine(1518)-N(6)/adenine(1519)-N(6))-dimethyltransferase RsmA [Patescibacteria group bacterium]
MQNSISQKIKDELDQLGIEPKKSLGQNFLINEGIYRKIVAALEIKRDETVVEIGPGLGTLTQYLVNAGAKVIAIEKDRRLIDWLKNKFKNNPKIKIVENDILKIDPRKLGLEKDNYKVVGNIPYYLTSRLIRTVFEKWPHPEKIVLMVQKEVAQRICAKPPEMSLLAVSVQYYSKPKIISYVSRNSFYPAPEVDSAIIKLETQNLELKTNEVKNFFKVVRAGFAGKRKQLANNLTAGLKISKQEIRQKLTLIDIDPQRRAETLTIEEWQRITNFLFSQG